MNEGSVRVLASSLEAACTRWSERPAITFGGCTISYGELWHRIDALARSYRRLGVKPGDRIVTQLRNGPEHIVAIGAAWQVGAIHAGTDNDLTGRELAWLVDNTRAAALLYQPRRQLDDPLAPVREVQHARPQTMVVLHQAERDDEGQVAFGVLEHLGTKLPPLDGKQPAHGPDDIGLLLLTSGTTGRPKAVMETLPACWAKMQFFADAFKPGPHDVHLLYLPTAHVFGLRLALLTLLSGGRLVLMDRFSPAAALDLVTTERVTVLPGMPTHFRLILAALDPERHDVSSLRWSISAASSLPRELVEEIYDRLDTEILYVYGCSENFTTLTTDRDEILAGSVGRTVFSGPPGEPPDGTVRIVDPVDHEPLPTGEVGEIAFGARRPVHYWRAPDTATDGWYYTGDLGRLDPDGTLYVMGRLKELVNRGGLKVSPSEVEVVMVDYPGIADAAIVGRPDPVLGEAICACVVTEGDDAPPTLAELRLYLGRYLARHKLPDEMCRVERIPRTKIGKVDRSALLAAVMTQGAPCERLR